MTVGTDPGLFSPGKSQKLRAIKPASQRVPDQHNMLTTGGLMIPVFSAAPPPPGCYACRGLSLEARSHARLYTCIVPFNFITSPPRSHLGRAHRSRTSGQRSPHWLQWDPQIHPKTAPSLRRTLSRLIHLSLDRLHSPPETAFGSNQPFCHNTLSDK